MRPKSINRCPNCSSIVSDMNYMVSPNQFVVVVLIYKQVHLMSYYYVKL